MRIIMLSFIFTMPAYASLSSGLVNPVDYFRAISKQVLPYKFQIQRCIETTKTIFECNGNMHGISPNITTPQGKISTLVTKHGVITIFPVSNDPVLSTDSYILTISIVGPNTLSWTASGLSVAKGYIQYLK
jgi:hypothetical protein